MDDDRNLISEVTRGFAGIREQIQARDDKVTSLSEKMIGVEYKIDQLKETLTKVESDMSKTENERIKMRVDALEEAHKESKIKQAENAKWIKGLVASVIMLLLGFIFNFIRIGIK
jgi:chromosome segregation ATPase